MSGWTGQCSTAELFNYLFIYFVQYHLLTPRDDDAGDDVDRCHDSCHLAVNGRIAEFSSSLSTTMSTDQTDIVVLGATGFTGKLITRYLSLHPQHTQGLFSFSIAARSQSRLHELVQDLSLPPTVNTIRVDVTNEAEVESVVKSARVVINTVGPYWRWGTPVVRYVICPTVNFLWKLRVFLYSQSMCK